MTRPPFEFHWKATHRSDFMLLRRPPRAQVHPVLFSVVPWVSFALLALATLAGFGVRLAAPGADALRRTPGLRLRLPKAPFADAASSPIALLATTAPAPADASAAPDAGAAFAPMDPDASAAGPLVVYFRDVAYAPADPAHRAALARELAAARETWTLRGPDGSPRPPSAVLYVDAAVPQARLHALLEILREAGLEDVLLASSP